MRCSDEDTSGYANLATVDRLRSTVVNALKDHCCNAATSHNSKLANIIKQVRAAGCC